MRALHIGFSINIIDDFKQNFYLDINLSVISIVPTILKKLFDQKLFIKEVEASVNDKSRFINSSL